LNTSGYGHNGYGGGLLGNASYIEAPQTTNDLKAVLALMCVAANVPQNKHWF
jgi:hypothetical protein